MSIALLGLLACDLACASPLQESSARAIAEAQVKILMKGKTADFLYSGDFGEQFIGALELTSSDAPQQPQEDDAVFIAGCRRHSCTEKAAAMVDLRTRKLLGIGIRHFHCSDGCSADPTVEYFVFQDEKQQRNSVPSIGALEAWGKQVGNANKKIHHCTVIASAARCD